MLIIALYLHPENSFTNLKQKQKEITGWLKYFVFTLNIEKKNNNKKKEKEIGHYSYIK